MQIRLGYTQDEVLAHSFVWLNEIIPDLVEYDIAEKRWGMKAALMSHTPMSKESAHGLQRELDETNKEFKAIIRSVRKPSFDRNAPIESSFKVELEPGESLNDILKGT